MVAGGDVEQLTKIIVFTFCAGACIPLGGLIAHVEKIRPRWLEQELRHFVIAFAGGILLAAVALILVPEGAEHVSNGMASVAFFIAGGLCFFFLERFLGARHSEKPQLTALLLDYLPESLVLGGALAIGAETALLLAIFIGLQNLPEGFNAYRELRASSPNNGRQILFFMCLLVPIGPAIAVAGWLGFGDNPAGLGGVMLFASGGILYLIFQDIAPQSRMQRHWAPPLGAVLGFALGMLGKSLVVS